MPLTEKGNKIMANMVKQCGPEKAKRVFYASENKGTITGVHRKKPKTLREHRMSMKGKFMADDQYQTQEEAAEENNLPPQLIEAVMNAESGFARNKPSREGATGPMQLRPIAAKSVGVNP